MKLIGAGLPRTGTLSQKVALETLGIGPCYHMVNVLADLNQAQLWNRALAGDGPWDQIFDGFQSLVDWPGSFFYKELADQYPDAKILLSTREPDGWVRSMRDTIWGIFYGDMLIRDLSEARERIDPKWHEYSNMMRGMWERSGLITAGEDTTSEDMANGMEAYNQAVQAAIPSDRLLVWSVSDGWEPLCEFLGIPVPESDFPHLNDSKVFADRVIDGSLHVLQEWRTQETQAVAAS
jgi:Sulfotransferase domain